MFAHVSARNCTLFNIRLVISVQSDSGIDSGRLLVLAARSREFRCLARTCDRLVKPADARQCRSLGIQSLDQLAASALARLLGKFESVGRVAAGTWIGCHFPRFGSELTGPVTGKACRGGVLLFRACSVSATCLG